MVINMVAFPQGGRGELPKNGSEWHAIRQGVLPDLPQMSADFNSLLRVRVFIF